MWGGEFIASSSPPPFFLFGFGCGRGHCFLLGGGVFLGQGGGERVGTRTHSFFSVIFDSVSVGLLSVGRSCKGGVLGGQSARLLLIQCLFTSRSSFVHRVHIICSAYVRHSSRQT